MLDITMQPLIQHIDFYFFCLKGSVISLEINCLGKQNIFFLVNIASGQEFTINAKTYLDMLFLNFWNISHTTFDYIDPGQGLEQGQESRYIQPSALGFTW